MDLLIGTRNQYKATEMVSFLEGILGVKVHYLDEIPETIIVEEDQNSLEANAIKKAIEISKHTDWYVLTSDGGVDIPGLGDKWDIMRNQRIVGETKTDQEKVDFLISLMNDLKGNDRKCTYRLALALAISGNLLWSFEDVTDTGYIIEKPQDIDIPPYRWMGHVWYYPQFNKTANQMDIAERNEIRKLAIGMKEKLQQYLREIS